MYSYEQKKRAIEVYNQYGKNYKAMFRELGYPCHNAFKKWLLELQNEGDVRRKYYASRVYTEEQKAIVIVKSKILSSPPWYTFSLTFTTLNTDKSILFLSILFLLIFVVFHCILKLRGEIYEKYKRIVFGIFRCPKLLPTQKQRYLQQYFCPKLLS